MSPDRSRRCILCIDLDCFFAQVLLKSRPDLVGKPVGIQQKYIIVTCTYEARALGITKLMLIEDALKIKPDLVILDGSDLTPFREVGRQFFQVTRATLGTEVPLERKGFDEIYADITLPACVLLEEERRFGGNPPGFQGHVFPPIEFLTHQQVESAALLKAGSQIAHELRRELAARLGLKSCAGVSSNKFGAKLASNMNKPNDQTTFILGNEPAAAYFRDLNLRSIPGLGSATKRLCRQNGLAEEVKTCGDLVDKVSLDELTRILSGDAAFAQSLMRLARGEDDREVEPMDVWTKQLSREETRLPHPTTFNGVRERLEELSLLLFDLIESRFDETFEWPTVVKLSIKFRGESGRRSKSRSLGTCLMDEPTLKRVALELWSEFTVSPNFVASHVNLCVCDFKPVDEATKAEGRASSSSSSLSNNDKKRGPKGLESFFGTKQARMTDQ